MVLTLGPPSGALGGAAAYSEGPGVILQEGVKWEALSGAHRRLFQAGPGNSSGVDFREISSRSCRAAWLFAAILVLVAGTALSVAARASSSTPTWVAIAMGAASTTVAAGCLLFWRRGPQSAEEQEVRRGIALTDRVMAITEDGESFWIVSRDRVYDAKVIRLSKEESKFRDLMIWELLFAKGLSQQEVARLVSTSEPTVSRARKALVDKLRNLVGKHAKADALEDLPSGDDAARLVASIWQENLFSCVKRSTLGSYALGVVDSEWADYIRFHLETVECEYCIAHLEDVRGGGPKISTSVRERIFASSVGFLR